MAKSVYLLEDDKSICELVQCALEMAGISLHAYTTVAAFEAALRSAPPAVALLDIMLPERAGCTDKNTERVSASALHYALRAGAGNG